MTENLQKIHVGDTIPCSCVSTCLPVCEGSAEVISFAQLTVFHFIRRKNTFFLSSWLILRATNQIMDMRINKKEFLSF